MNYFKTTFYVLMLSFVFTACSDDDDNGNIIDEMEEEVEEMFIYKKSYLVTNEGPFQNGFGTVSSLSEGLGGIENDIYQTNNNGDNLGNIVQSISFYEEDAYVIANVSNRITIVDRNTFVEKARLDEGLDNPRFMAIANEKGYVTNWGDPFVETDDYVAVIDLTTNTIVNTIAVPLGPEKIVFNESNIYVAHKGAFGTNNIVSVINPTSDEVITTIEVGDVPSGLEVDAQGAIWVLSSGNPEFTGNETGGQLSQINPDTNETVTTFGFLTTAHPNYLTIDGQGLFYYLDGEVFRLELQSAELPQPIGLSGLSLYNMEVSGNFLIGCNAGDFASNGSIEVYDLTTNTLTQTHTAGIIPGGIYFND